MMFKFFLISVALLLLQSHTKFPLVGARTLGKPAIWTEVHKGFKFFMDKYLSDKFRTSINPNDKVALTLKDFWMRRGMRALDRALSRDVIMITDNIALIKRKTDVSLDKENYSSSRQQEINSSTPVVSPSAWREKLITKIAYFLRTRVLQINFRNLNIIPSLREQARHKKNGGMGTMLMFGVVAAGLIVIPLGFQFLAVLGGKALLLAKLALILTSIQGLKKIATSNIHYGLYSTDTTSPWLYDRKLTYDFNPYQSIYHPTSLDNSPVLDKYVKSSDLTPFYPTINSRDSYVAPKSLPST
ncbi:uncharacterized protein Osi23 [Euwallacea fornicatus]|uniref:uncharacterized protein Osi23 n=1 Tax=Euwallacea fornicatus TaxID=995702 RepID=UPI00338FCCA6